MSEIQKFYKSKTIFLTGATGFLGKIMIWKLLKTTEVGAIYIIVRPKKQVSAEQRVKQLLDHEIFADVQKKLNKIKPLAGDLTKPLLGISEKDREIMQQKVDIIIHCGAYLNMISGIKESVICNVRSTRDILSLAKCCRTLISFIYISTAYSHCPKSVIEEKYYEAPISAEVLIKMIEECDDDILKSLSPTLRGDWPNYYTFSKAVAESLIYEASKDIPTGLFRPSIVTPTNEEPIGAWTDNIYGPMGPLLGINTGILRVLNISGTAKLDLVPADMVANGILCTVWDIDQIWRSSRKPVIMNFSGHNSEIYVSIKQFLNDTKVAMKSAAWYPVCYFIDHPVLCAVIDFFVHSIPYYVLEKVAPIIGKKPLASMSYQKISKGCKALNYFMVNEWTILNDNSQLLWTKLNDTDKSIYNFNVNAINQKKYFKQIGLASKQHLAKEDLNELTEHERRNERLKLLHFFTVGWIFIFLIIIIILFLYFVMKFIVNNIK